MSVVKEDRSLVSRIAHLDQMIGRRKLSSMMTSSSLSTTAEKAVRKLAGREALLDALIALYDECSGEPLKQHPLAAQFVTKYRSVVEELVRQRVSAADFSVLRTIGRGQFGHVQTVRQRTSGQVFAMKVLRKPEPSADNQAMFFEEERDIMSESTSPWLTSLHFAFQDSSSLYLVMDYHPGGDLMGLLERQDGSFPEQTARFYLAEIALALKDLHNMGYVHRDVKPDNVLLDRCGHVRLADFGSSARLSSSGSVTTSMPVGTPDYQAPEILCAINATRASQPGDTSGLVPLEKSITYGKECDYWALGVVAYELLTATTPFRGEKFGALEETYQNILDYKRTLKRPDDTVISDAAWSLICGLLSDRNRRLQHADLLQHEFFISVNWTAIGSSPPPYIPKLSSDDDTSHFDELSHQTASPPCLDTFITRGRNTFSGRQLPYVGFTYCRQDESERAGTVSSRSRASILTTGDKEGATCERLEKKIGEQRRQLVQLQEKVRAYEDGDTDKQLKQLTDKLKEKNELVSKLLEERERLEQTAARYDERAMAAERLLDMEKKNRLTTEKRALEMVQEMKRKWKREEDERIRNVQEEVKRCQEQYRQLEKQYTATVDRLREAKQQCDQAEDARKDSETRAKRSVGHNQESLRSDLEELQKRLQQATVSSEQQAAELSKRTAAHRQLTERLQNQLQQLVTDNSSLKNQVEQLNSESVRVQKLVTETEQLRRESGRLSRDRDQLQNQLSECDVIVEQLHDSKKQLTEQLKLVKTQLETVSASLTAESDRLSEQQKQHRCDTHTLQSQLDTCQLQRDQLQSQLTALQRKEESHQKRILELEQLLDSIQTSLGELERQRDSLAEQQSLTQQRVTDVEVDKTREEMDTLRATVKRLETQLDTVRDKAAVDRHKLQEMEEQMVKKEKQLNDWKIDVRIANREARTAETDLQQLRAAEQKWYEERQQLQQQENQLNQQLSTCQTEVDEARRQTERCVSEKHTLNSAHQEEIKRLEEKLESSEEKLLQVATLRVQLDTSEKELKRVERQLTEEQDRLKQKNEQLGAADVSAEKLSQQIADLRNQLLEKDNSLKSVKDLCGVLDTQLTEMDQLIVDKTKTIETLRQEKAVTQQNVDRVSGELRAARTAVNEHKSLRSFQERRADSLQQRLDELEGDVQNQSDTLKQQLEEYQQLARSLTEQLTKHDAQLSETRQQLRQAERQSEQLAIESNVVREESSALRTQLTSLRQSNLKLSEALETALDRAENFKTRVSELEDQIEQLQSCQDENDKRYEDTLKQQTKLIDFLQAKTESMPKKKTLAGRIFGSESATRSTKENVNPVPLRYRELERLLQQERSNSKHLADQLTCARAEIVALSNKAAAEPATPCIGSTPRSRQALRVLAQSPGVQETPRRPTASSASQLQSQSGVLYDSSSATGAGASLSQPTPQRMHHSIPHRFDTGLMTRASKCAACLRPVRFGRQVSRCHECHVTVHPKCASELPRTCGLPAALARHFSSSWLQSGVAGEQSSTVTAVAGGPTKPPRTLLSSYTATDGGGGHGWIRTPRSGKSGWEQRYMVVSDHQLCVFSEQPSSLTSKSSLAESKPVISIDLAGSHVHIDPDVAYSEVPQLARRDLPYVFKVVLMPDSTCWPPQTHHFLCSSLLDKQCWIRLLESTAGSTAVAGEEQTAVQAADKTAGPANISVMFTADQQHNLDINCAHLIDDGLMLLGTEDGLYSVCMDGRRPETLVRVTDFPGVLMIRAVPSVDQVVFIAGSEHRLSTTEQLAVRACAEAASTSAARLETVGLDGIEQCHLVTAAVTSTGQVFVCAASADRICVFCWSQQLVCYQLVKQFSTQEPATCLHITPRSSAIIGTDRFFEVDLTNFCIEEFLDSSDSSLSYIIYGTSQLRSFPVAILSLSDFEYLLCFHELGVFVDQYGARSRPHDIKWTRLPLAFAYHAPFVYIFHFNSVEVLELNEEAFTEKCPAPAATCQIQLSGPRLLAAASELESATVYLATSQAACAQICRVQVQQQLVTETGSDRHHDHSGSVSASIENASQTDAESLNFSFTPSVEEAIGTGAANNLTDTGSITSSDLGSMTSVDDAAQRRQVHFKDTVLVRQHTRPPSTDYDSDTKRRKC